MRLWWGLVGLSIASGAWACVSDAPIGPDSGSGMDADNKSDGSAGDGGTNMDAACAPPDDGAAGVLCVDTRCNALTEFCCMGFTGGNMLTGVCAPNSSVGDGGKQGVCGTQQMLYLPCSKAKDCTSGGAVCCLPPGLFTLKDAGACPATIDIPPEDKDATMGGPPMGPSCSSSCSGLQLCAFDSECQGGKKCEPAKVANATFGVCQ